MPIPCLATETAFEVQCPVCGRGFMLLTEPRQCVHTSSIRRAVRHRLAMQHETALQCENAHPRKYFELQGWDGEAESTTLTLSFLANCCA